jgi:hypothetical protein
MRGASCLSPFQGWLAMVIIPGAACSLRSHSPLATFVRAYGALLRLRRSARFNAMFALLVPSLAPAARGPFTFAFAGRRS